MQKTTLLFFLLFTCFYLHGQQFIADTTAKRLGIKAVLWKTEYTVNSKAKCQAETYNTNGKITIRAKASGNNYYNDTTLFFYDSNNRKTMEVGSYMPDTLTFTYNAEGRVSSNLYKSAGELYQSRIVYFANKDYITGIEDYELSDKGDVNSIWYVNLNEKGDTIESGSEAGTYYTFTFDYDTQGRRTKKTTYRPAFKTPSIITYTYDIAGRLEEKGLIDGMGREEKWVYTYNEKALLEKITHTGKTKEKPEGTILSTTHFAYTFY